MVTHRRAGYAPISEGTSQRPKGITNEERRNKTNSPAVFFFFVAAVDAFAFVSFFSCDLYFSTRSNSYQYLLVVTSRDRKEQVILVK